MSLVGPRPERKHFVDRFLEEIPLYGKRLLVPPGITGWAQVHHTYDTSVEDVIEKLRYDLFYVNHVSVKLDLLILLKTFDVVLRGRGAR
jgi:lipopolysaccharide/colanic/teichoic acid biosynthesis glycosyltransferase